MVWLYYSVFRRLRGFLYSFWVDLPQNQDRTSGVHVVSLEAQRLFLAFDGADLFKDKQHLNIWVISTFKYGYPRLTLKEGTKVKSDHIGRFLAHDFL